MVNTMPLFLDCDPGIDDAVALTVLLRSPQAHLVGVGTVAGNVDPLQGARNAAALLKLSDHPTPIPIGVGAAHPLGGTFSGGFPHVHGENGLGEESLPPGEADFGDAVELLVDLARTYRGALRIVAIGPLTNLALALDKEPSLPELVAGVYIMGGAWAVPGNVSPFAEANLWSDPAAADRVLTSGLPITLIPLDVTMVHLLNQQDITELSGSTDGLTSTLGRMLQFYGQKYQATLGDVLTPLHDPLTAAVALNLVAVTANLRTPVRVDVDQPHQGRLRAGDRSTPPVDIVLAVEASAAAHVREIISGDRHE